MTLTDCTTDPEYLSLLETVRTFPEDDAPRLILSDWLEENGEDERAEFIRLDIKRHRRWPDFAFVCDADRLGRYPDHDDLRRIESRLYELAGPHSPGTWAERYWKWFVEDYPGPTHDWNGVVVSRGFVSEVRLPCAAFVVPERECEACRGRGEIDEKNYHGAWETWRCGACSGTGRVEGLARRLFAEHPITRVVLTDKRPSAWGDEDPGGFHWGWEYADRPAAEFRVPRALMELTETGKRAFAHRYDTEPAALAALSRAAVAYGRALAGLPPLTTPDPSAS